VVVAAVLVAAIYLIGANVILNTGVLDPVINNKPEKLLVEWESGYTLLPGVVHIEGFRVRGQSKSVQWQCRLRSGDFRLSLLPLIRKRVRIHSGDGRDFEFWAARRLAEDGSDAGMKPHLPVIEGLHNPPDPRPEDLYPPRERRRRNPWRIDAGGIVLAGAVDIWLGRLRMAGSGEVGGHVDFTVGGDLELPEILFDLDGAQVGFRSQGLAQDVHLDVTGSMSRVNLRETRGSEIFRHLTADIALSEGYVPSLAALGAFLPAKGLMSDLEGSGTLALRLSADAASGDTTGEVEMIFDETRAKVGDRRLIGDVAIRATLDEGDLAAGRFGLDEARFDVTEVRGLSLEGEVDFDTQPWWGEVTLADGIVDIGEPTRINATLGLRMRDTKPLIRVLAGKANDEGEVKLPFALRLVPNVKDVEGSARLDMGEEHIRLRDVAIDGDGLRLEAELEVANPPTALAYIRLKGVPAAIRLQDGKRNIRVIRPRRWYERQLEEMLIASR
ncbi:MAG: hypothetical protein R3190_14915, partial [Thermoanaerobaculia bacterium]|nr:hypothetical protein [Thermoanaerobaculia bacterium]